MGGRPVRQIIGRAVAAVRKAGGRQVSARPDAGSPESERRFREVFQASPVGMALADENGLYVEVNPAWCELLGRPPEQLIGRWTGEFTHPEDPQEHDQSHPHASTTLVPGVTVVPGVTGSPGVTVPPGVTVEPGRPGGPDGVLRVERRWIRPDGELRWGWLSIAPVHGPNGENWTLAHAQDLTERKRAELVLQQSQDTLTAMARVARCVQSGEDPRPVLAAEVRWLSQASSVSILESTGAGSLTVTHCLGHELAGVQVRQMTGAIRRIWDGGPPEFLDQVGVDDWGFGDLPAPPSTASCWWQPLSDNQRTIGVLVVTWDHAVDGEHDPSVASVRALAEEAASVLTAARVRMELEALADTDALTGLANRRGWQTSLRELSATARQTGRPLTLALVDLDHFKSYNDAYGHPHGDVLLRNFAMRAKAMLRKADVIARWGGEEFAIGLPGCGAADAGPLLDRLRAVVPDGQTCSIGYATLSETESAADCLVRADSMLYRAKREGRNRVVGAGDATGTRDD